MNISSLLSLIRSLPAYQQMQKKLSAGSKLSSPLGLPRSVRVPIAVCLAEDLKVPLIYIVPRTDRVLTYSEEIPYWSSSVEIFSFPEPNPLFYEKAPWGPRTLRNRIKSISALTADIQEGVEALPAATDARLMLVPVRALMTRTLPPDVFQANSSWLKEGSSIRLDPFLSHLVDIGYAHASLVTEPGQFSRRGGILDLWPPSEASPIRAELFGNEIDSLRSFDPASQRSIHMLHAVRVTPAREGLPKLYQETWDALQPPMESLGERRPLLEFFLPWMSPTPSGLLDFVPDESLILIDDRVAIENTISEIEEQALTLRQDQIESGELVKDFPLPYLTLPEINEGFDRFQVVDLGILAPQIAADIDLPESFQPGPRFGGQLKPLMDHISQRMMHHETVVVVSRQASRLVELSAQSERPRSVLETLPKTFIPGDLHFVQGALSSGWSVELPDANRLHLLTDAEIFGWAKPRPRPRPRIRSSAPESAYADLKKDDIVVHVDYGIGRFHGLVERTLDNLQREYLLIKFAEGDEVYVPIHQADRITRYLGTDGTPPNLSRLGTQEWERAKGKVRKAVEDVAQDLLDLYARRVTVVGHAFSKDSAWQQDLESSFPYYETEDQLEAIEAVKEDMEYPRPMDRLICGDVGYGKTEVALRAAFKAVMDGKQVALLVPTTVLAQQHFNTFKQRLSAFPVKVEMLSRFRTHAEIQEILRRQKSGELDIVIGTHRLLQSDVEFKDLGMLIIDEEQRFGVTHKEYIKKKRTEIDVLTMTATPIPRTLYMALTGARDISTINTPPEERLPVITHIGPYEPRLIRQAVLREMDRGGQVFFVHNRVQTIEAARRRIERLVPEGQIGVAHGQMPEKDLSSIMQTFADGDIDILVSTSIIESGLDIPNANTLIVDQADRFGLAQLYQLRGRVGRGGTRAYAYFFRHPNQRITEEALQRLEVIAEHTELGSGYSIAMHDLEIRGAGDILGTRQHGHIAAVGFHLYTRLLGTAIRRLKAKYGDKIHTPKGLPQTEMPLAVSIDLPLPSAIPADYIPDRNLRLQLYRRMAEIRSAEAISSLAVELDDRFGEIPPEVDNLLYQLELRILAAEADVESISTENGKILIKLPPSWNEVPTPNFGPNVRRSKRGLWYARPDSQDWQRKLSEILQALRDSRG
jgi:transcription-repair coupling factor (superfamily II helicase)